MNELSCDTKSNKSVVCKSVDWRFKVEPDQYRKLGPIWILILGSKTFLIKKLQIYTFKKIANGSLDKINVIEDTVLDIQFNINFII